MNIYRLVTTTKKSFRLNEKTVASFIVQAIQGKKVSINQVHVKSRNAIKSSQKPNDSDQLEKKKTKTSKVIKKRLNEPTSMLMLLSLPIVTEAFLCKPDLVWW